MYAPPPPNTIPSVSRPVCHWDKKRVGGGGGGRGEGGGNNETELKNKIKKEGKKNQTKKRKEGRVNIVSTQMLNYLQPFRSVNLLD